MHLNYFPPFSGTHIENATVGQHIIWNMRAYRKWPVQFEKVSLPPYAANCVMDVHSWTSTRLALRCSHKRCQWQEHEEVVLTRAQIDVYLMDVGSIILPVNRGVCHNCGTQSYVASDKNKHKFCAICLNKHSARSSRGMQPPFLYGKGEGNCCRYGTCGQEDWPIIQETFTTFHTALRLLDEEEIVKAKQAKQDKLAYGI